MAAAIKPYLLMLEDDRERIQRFQAVLQRSFSPFHLVFARTAPNFVDLYQSLSIPPVLIALDHDLFVDDPAREPDPGDGRDVARFMATKLPIAPVLIHSTNSFAAESMLLTLRDAGWQAERISPLGDDWIETYWKQTVAPHLRA